MIALLTLRNRYYYGWTLVVVLALTELVSYGVLYYPFTNFIEPMQTELGWSRGEISGAFSLAMLITGLAAPPLGYIFDRYGVRWVMTLGSILAAAMVFAWANVRDLGIFYLIWAGIGVAMAAVLYEPAFWVVAVWFRRRRSRAFTLMTFLAGFSSVIFIPLAQSLIQAQGWRGALITLAVILAVITVPIHFLLIRRRPEDIGSAVDGGDGYRRSANSGQQSASGHQTPATSQEQSDIASRTSHSVLSTQHSALTTDSHGVQTVIRTATFWWLTAAFFFNMLMITALGVHLVPMLRDKGFDAGFAASAAGFIGLMSLPGRLVFTMLGERLPRRWVIAAIFLAMTAALVVLIGVQSQASVILFVVLYGAGFGAIAPGRAALVADLYGSESYGRINSVIALVTTLSRVIAPVMAGVLYDSLRSYTPVLWGLVVISALSVMLSLMIGSGSDEQGIMEAK